MNDINFFWQIVTNLFDVLLLNYFLYSTGKKKKKKISTVFLLLSNLIYLLSITYVNLYAGSNWMNFGASIFFVVIVSLFYKDRITGSFIYSCVFIGVMLVAEMLSASVLIIKDGAFVREIHYIEGSLLTKLWELLMIGLFVRFSKENSGKAPVKSSILYVIISVLCVFVSMCFTDNFEMYKTDRLFSFWMGITGLLFLNFLVYVSFEELQRMYQKAMEIELMRYEAEKKEEHYRQLEENQAEVRKIRHDLKHQLIEIKSVIQKKENAAGASQEALDDILGRLDGKGIYCDNIAVNAVLKEKFQQAKKENIKIEHEIHIMDSFQLDLGDMGTLLGNLLDNAIEASRKTEDPWIYVNMFQKGNCMNIIIKNKKSPFDTGWIGKTTKRDKKNHGIGLKSVTQIVEKYNGAIQTEKGKQEFCVKIIVFERKKTSFTPPK